MVRDEDVWTEDTEAFTRELRTIRRKVIENNFCGPFKLTSEDAREIISSQASLKTGEPD